MAKTDNIFQWNSNVTSNIYTHKHIRKRRKDIKEKSGRTSLKLVMKGISHISPTAAQTWNKDINLF